MMSTLKEKQHLLMKMGLMYPDNDERAIFFC
jgi:hypothetical protein